VRRAGGVPVYLPPGEDLFPGVLDRLDGIIFAGGADIHPGHYGRAGDGPDAGEGAWQIGHGSHPCALRGSVPVSHARPEF
jgi:hypothetical protein